MVDLVVAVFVVGLPVAVVVVVFNAVTGTSFDKQVDIEFVFFWFL